MLRSTFLFVLALTSALLGTSAYAAGPFGTIHVGNWSGGAYTNDSTAAFSHCAAGASYVSGFKTPLRYMLRVMRDPNADTKRRDAMATAAAPYLHSKLSAVDTPPANIKEKPRVSVAVSFVDPPDYPEDQ